MKKFLLALCFIILPIHSAAAVADMRSIDSDDLGPWGEIPVPSAPNCQYFFQPDCSSSEQWDILIRLIPIILVILFLSFLLIFVIFFVLWSYFHWVKKDSVRAIQYRKYVSKLFIAMIILLVLFLWFPMFRALF